MLGAWGHRPHPSLSHQTLYGEGSTSWPTQPQAPLCEPPQRPLAASPARRAPSGSGRWCRPGAWAQLGKDVRVCCPTEAPALCQRPAPVALPSPTLARSCPPRGTAGTVVAGEKPFSLTPSRESSEDTRPSSPPRNRATSPQPSRRHRPANVLEGSQTQRALGGHPTQHGPQRGILGHALVHSESQMGATGDQQERVTCQPRKARRGAAQRPDAARTGQVAAWHAGVQPGNPPSKGTGVSAVSPSPAQA